MPIEFAHDPGSGRTRPLVRSRLSTGPIHVSLSPFGVQKSIEANPLGRLIPEQIEKPHAHAHAEPARCAAA
jgi:hypothetical protein